MERSPIKDIEIKHLLQNTLVDEINSHEIFMKSINIIYYHEGYTEYNIEDL
ncbi:cell filamentation protein Fic [Bacillus paranthracis]